MKLRFGIVLVCVAAAIVVATLLSSPSEPVYHGRTLSEWAHDMDELPVGGEIPFGTNRTEAVEAIRHIGTKALPFALDYCGTEESKLREKFVTWVNERKFFGVNVHFSHDDDYQKIGVLILRALGPEAKAAIPKLIELFRSDQLYTAGHASEALCYIGVDAVEPLIKALTNSNPRVRLWAAETLGGLESTAHEAAPDLIRSLGDSDVEVRGVSAIALIQVECDPAVTIPPLLRCLADSHFGRRDYVAIALGHFHQEPEKVLPALFAYLDEQTNGVALGGVFNAIGRFGTNARPWIPVLVAMIETNRFRFPIDSQALSALRKIDPEKAEEIYQRREFMRTNSATGLSPVLP